MARRRTVRQKRVSKPDAEGPAVTEDATNGASEDVAQLNSDRDPIDTSEGAEQPAEASSPPPATATAMKPAPRRTRTTRKRVGKNDDSDATIEALRKRREEARNVGNEKEPPVEEDTAEIDVPQPSDIPPQSQTPTRPARRAARSVQATPVQSAAQTDTGTALRGRTRGRSGSVLKAEGTPLVESSLLILQKFQRRQRQPSVLRMVGGGGSKGGEDDDDDQDLSDFDFDDGDLLINSSPVPPKKTASEDVVIPATPIPNTQDQELPEGTASTEIVIEATQTEVVIQVPATAESSYEKTPPSPLATPATQKRKRTPPVAESRIVPPSSPPLIKSSALPVPDPDSDDEPLSDVSSLSDLGDIADIEPGTDVETQEDEETILAPPMSCSDDESEPERPPKVAKTKSTKHTKSGQRKSLTTSALTSLLPRPRARHPISSPSDDESDSPHPAPAKRNRRTSLSTETTSGLNARVNLNSNSTPYKRTYSRRSQPIKFAHSERRNESDRENEGEEDDQPDTPVISKVSASKELSAAAKKFEEIDKWSMEFESVSQSTNDEGAW